ncbi:MAG: hypothetical protein KAQ93_02445 [Spirochaetales bacterium]|nr:hypothetical protein [Spirochaetales bacterium]
MKKYLKWLMSTRNFIVVCFILAVIFFVSACATSGFLGFGDPLATSSYVDTAIAEMEQETERISIEFDQMNAEIKAFTSLRNEIENIIATMEKTQKDTAELQNLADRVGERLEEMPNEMLRQLVEALQTYLEMMENQ